MGTLKLPPLSTGRRHRLFVGVSQCGPNVAQCGPKPRFFHAFDAELAQRQKRGREDAENTYCHDHSIKVKPFIANRSGE